MLLGGLSLTWGMGGGGMRETSAFSDKQFFTTFDNKKINRKVQEEPQANSRHQEEEKKWHRLRCA